MFTIYHSNDVSILKSLVVELMQREPLSNPFAKETVLVQSPGMSQWLRLNFAENFGIAANIDFPLPATFVWNIFKAVLEEVPERSAFSKQQMSWRLMQIIPKYLDQPEFKPLQSYLSGDTSQIKRYQLSAKVADLFDQYLVYRSEWINTWESGSLVDALNGDDGWQAILWRALYKQTVDSGFSHFHRANLYDQCVSKLESGFCPESIRSLKRIYVFGISALPPRYIDVLNALGKHIDVHFMLTNPCQYYWGDIIDQKYLSRMTERNRLSHASGTTTEIIKDSVEAYLDGSVGNSLLASWGKVGRDMQRLLSEYAASEIEAFIEHSENSMLHAIQKDMLQLNDRYSLENNTNSFHKTIIDTQDASIQVNVCHTAMREVEVLHDYLLSVMDDNSDIQPRDIVVMVSDIDAYSAYIHAVFASASKDRYIPFSISDLSSNQYHSVIQAYIWLLGIQDHRCSASELMSFIQVPAVLSRFKIDEPDLEVLSHWVSSVGIRWGLDETTAEGFDLPSMQTNTWLFGLRRMLSGYALSESVGIVDGVLPYEQIQGLSVSLAGKLGVLIDALIRVRDQWQTSLPASQWKDQLVALKDTFFCASNDDDGRQLIKISEGITRWADEVEQAGLNDVDHPLTAEVILDVMSETLIEERISQRFLAGQTNFCTLMPMRSVPFKVVCLLGMDGNAYPRQQTPLGFDLMHDRFEYGDRSRRDDDRFLFLEAVLSAQSSLYISYTGKSSRDNSEIIPSILVSELLDYCGEGFTLEQEQHLPPDDSRAKVIEHIVNDQSMTPYSKLAFDSNKGKPSYAQQWLDIAMDDTGLASNDGKGFGFDLLSPFPIPERVDLAELKAFWGEPVKYFMTRRLKVFFSAVDDTLVDDESFELNNLEAYQLKDRLTEWLLDNVGSLDATESRELEELQRIISAEGILPHAAFGRLVLSEQLDAANQIARKVSSFNIGDHKSLEINFDAQFDDQCVILEGWLSNVSRAGFVNYRVGRIRPKDLFFGWIDHLAAAAMGECNTTHCIGFNGKTGQIEHIAFTPIATEKAKVTLNSLIQTMINGTNQPMFFSLEQAGMYCEKLSGPKGDEETARAALEEMLNTYLEENEYAHRCWNHINDEMLNSFIADCEMNYSPMVDHVVAVNNEEI